MYLPLAAAMALVVGLASAVGLSSRRPRFTVAILAVALAPVAPGIYTSPDALSAITHIPVIVIQGDEDPLVRVETTRTWVAKMAELGMTHRYVEIPGGDHTMIIARDPDNMKAIFDFFDQARRN